MPRVQTRVEPYVRQGGSSWVGPFPTSTSTPPYSPRPEPAALSAGGCSEAGHALKPTPKSADPLQPWYGRVATAGAQLLRAPMIITELP